MTGMTDDLIAELEQQELDLVLERFDHADAWALGSLLVKMATERRLPVAIDIRHGEQQVFHAGLAGSVADNDRWIERKARVVDRFGHSSLYMRVLCEQDGTTLEEKFLLDGREFAAHGGAFPLLVRGVGPVGTVVVSGLPQLEDHRFVVEVLTRHLAS